MIDVATISKLFKSDALAEFVIVKPNIKKIGAAISKTINSQSIGNSALVNFCVSSFSLCIIDSKDIPMPAPKYKNPAINVGGILFKRSLDSGMFIAYRQQLILRILWLF